MTQSTPLKHPSASRTSSADSCGCAMGARFLGGTVIASSGWFAWHWHEYSLARGAVRILIFAFAGAVVGKLVGIAVYRQLIFAFAGAVVGKLVGIAVYRLRARRWRERSSANARAPLPAGS